MKGNEAGKVDEAPMLCQGSWTFSGAQQVAAPEFLMQVSDTIRFVILERRLTMERDAWIVLTDRVEVYF